MKHCRFCNSKNLVKSAFIKGKQRFLCKDCKRKQLIKDGRQKYDQKTIQTAMILFSEGNNYRRIARILNKIYDINIRPLSKPPSSILFCLFCSFFQKISSFIYG
jgi:transposase-like protein